MSPAPARARLQARSLPLVLAFAVAGTLVGCAPAGQAGSNGDGGSGHGESVTVFAAASLKAVFTELAGSFEASHPGTKVSLSFAGSSDLATQISQGAPADVFASADTRNMDKLEGQGLLDGDPRKFATNTLTIVVPPGNPAGITGFGDLARPGVKLVACATQVPCGAAANAIGQSTGTTLSPVSEESSVTDVLGKVTSGEADAGLVYVTDARAAGNKAVEVPFPEASVAINTYPIAAVKGSADKQSAEGFVQYVLGAEGQSALAAAGFGTP